MVLSSFSSSSRGVLALLLCIVLLLAGNFPGGGDGIQSAEAGEDAI